MKKPRIITDAERIEREESLARMVRGIGKLIVELEPDYIEGLLKERNGDKTTCNDKELGLES